MEIFVPISLGELYDKISILFIKLEHIKAKEKLKNIEREYNLLQEIAKENPIDQNLYFDLVKINSRLWRLEDSIRLKEKEGSFDDKYTQMAKDIYHTNDDRSEIKRKINTEYGSDIIEEKSYS